MVLDDYLKSYNFAGLLFYKTHNEVAFAWMLPSFTAYIPLNNYYCWLETENVNLILVCILLMGQNATGYGLTNSWSSLKHHEIWSKEGILEGYSTTSLEREVRRTFWSISQTKVGRSLFWKYTSLSQCIWLDAYEWLCILGWFWYLSFWCGRYSC